MANEQNQNLEFAPFFATGEDKLQVDQKQVLNASLSKQINQSCGPHPNPMDHHHNQLSDPKNAERTNSLTVVPSSHNEVSAEIKPCTNNEIVVWQGGAADETTDAPEVSHLPYTERKQDWIIRCLPRTKLNAWDSYYVHLQTDKQFKSLVSAHAFIVHGHLPKRRVNKMNAENATQKSTASTLSRRHVRGDKLLNRVPVGYYNLTTREIFRGVTPPAGARGSGHKRKRENEAAANEMGETAGIPNLIYVLYDFEPIN